MREQKLAPKWLIKLIHLFCDKKFIDEIEGDLQELYEENVSEKGRQKAAFMYFLDVLPYFRPYFFRKRKTKMFYAYTNSSAMIKNYLLIYIRNLKRQKIQSFISITSLALGLAAFAMILIWVKHELSYDTFHTKQDRIYRLASTVKTDTETFSQAVTSPPIGLQLKEDFPEIEEVVRIDFNDAVIKKNSTVLSEDGLMFTDPSIFDVFDFKLLKGDAKTALSRPYQLVLSESMARRYFGEKDPLGETITLYLFDPGQQGATYLITGIIEDSPINTQLQYEALGSFSTIEQAYPEVLSSEGWFWNGYYTYILLKEETALSKLKSKIPVFVEKYMGEEMKKFSMYYAFHLQPLKSLYLDSQMRYQPPTGNRQNLQIFSAIGIFILLLAIINYVNLSTAVSVKKEQLSGIRKILGAKRVHLIIQYLSESVFTAMFALVLAVVLMELVRPWFYLISNKQALPFYTSSTLSILFFTALLAGLISGIYPALVFSKVTPLNNLQKRNKGQKGIVFRKILVTGQFIITVFLIAGVLIINQQFNLIRNMDIGMEKDNILLLKVNGDNNVISKYEVFKEKLLKEELITSVASSRTTPVGGLSNSLLSTIDGEGKQVNSSIYQIRIDADFIDTYGITLKAGRNLLNRMSDSTAFIINEAAVSAFGWQSAEEALGKPISQAGIKGEVVGVANNFHFNSLEYQLAPVSMYKTTGNISVISIRYKGNTTAALSMIETHWESIFPDAYFDYSFFNKEVENQYKNTKRFAYLFHAFSALCLLIAVLGLFGLVSFATEQRKKEIGVRKVLGASVKSIVWLVSAEFTGLILLAIIIATPIGWYAMEIWLQGFAYKTIINLWLFLGAGILVYLFAFLSGIGQALKSALTDPVKSLKYE